MKLLAIFAQIGGLIALSAFGLFALFVVLIVITPARTGKERYEEDDA